jgi:hypothetical protein
LKISNALTIASNLSGRSAEFNDRPSAIKFCEDQPHRWRTIFSSLGGRNSGLGPLFSSLQNNLDNAHFEVIELPVEEIAAARVVSEIPLLTDVALSTLEAIANEDFDLVASAVLFECRNIGGGTKITTMSLDILAAMQIYVSRGIPTQDILKKLAEFQAKMEGAEQRTSATLEQLRLTTDQFFKDETEKLSAFKQSLTEEIQLRSASQLWSNRAISHRAVAGASFLAFILILGAVLWYGAEHFKEIVAQLPRDKDGHIEYVSVALLAIPAIGIGWCLRVLARFIHMNSVLGDDSRQRQAMTRTYLALVADKDSQVTKEDRLIMLNAIFRPLPGSQVEEVAPPTILDLLKKGEHA